LSCQDLKEIKFIGLFLVFALALMVFWWFIHPATNEPTDWY
jgi:hypothetical protein